MCKLIKIANMQNQKIDRYDEFVNAILTCDEDFITSSIMSLVNKHENTYIFKKLFSDSRINSNIKLIELYNENDDFRSFILNQLHDRYCEKNIIDYFIDNSRIDILKLPTLISFEAIQYFAIYENLSVDEFNKYINNYLLHKSHQDTSFNIEPIKAFFDTIYQYRSDIFDFISKKFENNLSDFLESIAIDVLLYFLSDDRFNIKLDADKIDFISQHIQDLFTTTQLRSLCDIIQQTYNIEDYAIPLIRIALIFSESKARALICLSEYINLDYHLSNFAQNIFNVTIYSKDDNYGSVIMKLCPSMSIETLVYIFSCVNSEHEN